MRRCLWHWRGTSVRFLQLCGFKIALYPTLSRSNSWFFIMEWACFFVMASVLWSQDRSFTVWFSLCGVETANTVRLCLVYKEISKCDLLEMLQLLIVSPSVWNVSYLMLQNFQLVFPFMQRYFISTVAWVSELITCRLKNEFCILTMRGRNAAKSS